MVERKSFLEMIGMRGSLSNMAPQAVNEEFEHTLA